MRSPTLPEHVMTIDGAAVVGEGSFPVIDPARGEAFGDAPECSADQLEEAMASAARAGGPWSGDESHRRAILAKAADALEAAVDEIAPLLTAEQGKPLAGARGEIASSARWLRYFADLDVDREIIRDDDGAVVEIVRRPLGVVAAITPWNFPLSMAAWKIAPALRAGNTVVLKPSPFTPLSSLAMGQVLASVLPPGVLNVVSGGDELGGRMTEHPAVRKISFTGSVATGKKVAAAAAPDLKRLTLELGGNDPAIVLDDADVDRVADRLFASAFANCGQVCIAVKRVYAPERLYGALVDALGERARATRVGDGREEGTQLGPINNRPQLERVLGLLGDATDHGARVVAGGHRLDRPGYFVEPTIVADVEDGVRLVDEEQFGPVLPVVAYRDLDEVTARANDTHFGLGGSVWSSDADRAEQVARRLECGTVWVNTHGALAPEQPFGGLKWSGVGVEHGLPGLFSYTEIQVVHRQKA